MQIDAATLSLVVQLVTLAVLVGGGVQFFTRLKLAQDQLAKDLLEVRGDIEKHTQEEDARFNEFRTRFHTIGEALQRGSVRLENHEVRLGGLERRQAP